MSKPRNTATGSARVGIQADNLTVTGGLTIRMPGRRSDDTGQDGDTTAVQHGTRDTASGSDRVGVQVGRVTGKVTYR